jgi:hypothetical protein
MEQIRASSLNSYNRCPRAYFELPFDGKQEDLFFGTIQHYAARWYDIDQWLDYYFANINQDIKLHHIGKQLAEKIKDWYFAQKDVSEIYHAEVPFLTNKLWVWLEGTADSLYKIKWEWNMKDFKTTKHADFYLKWDVREEYAQHYIYTRLACEYLEIDWLQFGYIPLEKNNSARVYYDECKRFITKEEAEKKSKEIVSWWLFAKETGIYEEKINSGCRFCKLNTVCQKYHDTFLSIKVVE